MPDLLPPSKQNPIPNPHEKLDNRTAQNPMPARSYNSAPVKNKKGPTDVGPTTAFHIKVNPSVAENPRSARKYPSKPGSFRSFRAAKPNTGTPRPVPCRGKRRPCLPASRTATEEVRSPGARNTGCKDSPGSRRRAADTPRPSGTPASAARISRPGSGGTPR